MCYEKIHVVCPFVHCKLTFLLFPLFLNLKKRSRVNPSAFPMLSLRALLTSGSEIPKYPRATVSTVLALNSIASLAISLSVIFDGN